MNRIQSLFRFLGGLAALLWLCMVDSTPLLVQLGWLGFILVAFAISGDLRRLFN